MLSDDSVALQNLTFGGCAPAGACYAARFTPTGAHGAVSGRVFDIVAFHLNESFVSFVSLTHHRGCYFNFSGAAIRIEGNYVTVGPQASNSFP